MPTGVENVLLQSGAIGAFAIVALYAVAKLFARQVSQHERDIARADKAEQQLLELNKVIREQIVPLLTRATDVMGRVAQMLDEQRHSDRKL